MAGRSIDPRGRTRRSTRVGRMTIATVVAMAMLVTTLGAAATAATRPISFRIEMGDCPRGGATDSATLRVTWRDADGSLKATGPTTASATGDWVFCGTTAGDAGPDGIEPGDRLEVVERGGSSRSYVVPAFLVRVDRASDVVSGRAPAGSQVQLLVSRDTQNASRTVTVDAGGRFTTDLTDRFDIRGGDLVTMELFSGRDRVKTSVRVPWLRIWVGRATLDWTGSAGMAGLVTLTTTDRRRATAAVGEGTGRGRFLDAEGDPVRPRVGDTVDGTILATDARIRLPDVRLTVDPGTDVIRATCPAGRIYHLTVLKGGASTAAWQVRAVSAGTDTYDLTGRLNVVKGSIAVLDCILATGDRAAIRRVAG